MVLVLQPHLWRGAAGGVVEPSCAGLVTSSPEGPFEDRAGGGGAVPDQLAEEATDLWDGERDEVFVGI